MIRSQTATDDARPVAGTPRVPSVRTRRVRATRSGFTLIELLVVIGILLLIMAITASAINVSISGDKVRGAARQVQSYLEGARGRAIYGGNASTQGATYQCGVRFIRDPNNTNLVTSMQYVEIEPERGSITGGVYGIQYNGANATVLVGTTGSPNETANTRWYERSLQGLIFNNQVIMLDDRRYLISTSALAAGNEVLILQTPYVGTTPYAAPGDTNGYAVPQGRQPPYKLLLAPQPMANQEPRLLGNGVVLDLNLSKGLGYFTTNALQIDVMFSPRGTIVGPLAGTGLVEFVVSDREDSMKSIPLPMTGNLNPVTKRDRLIVSLTPQTGKTAVHPVYVDPLGATADPYRYAETGEVARQ